MLLLLVLRHYVHATPLHEWAIPWLSTFQIVTEFNKGGKNGIQCENIHNSYRKLVKCRWCSGPLEKIMDIYNNQINYLKISKVFMPPSLTPVS